MTEGDGNGSVPYVVYTDADLIKLRKIRDTLGCIWGSPNLTDGQRSILAETLVALSLLPGVIILSSDRARGTVLDKIGFGTPDAWKQFY